MRRTRRATPYKVIFLKVFQEILMCVGYNNFVFREEVGIYLGYLFVYLNGGDVNIKAKMFFIPIFSITPDTSIKV